MIEGVMAESHRQRVARSFDQQASAFEDARFNQVMTSESAWLLRHLDPGPEDLVLDVAAGTGHAGRALAPSVRGVIALDSTPTMLATGKTQAEREGLGNLVFQRGDAEALPFLDASFSVVVCRYAVHHFSEPAVQVLEMVRCLRAGGRLVIADLICDPDPEIAGRQNALETLRDPSHARMLSRAALLDLVALAGLATLGVELREIERPLAPWLAQTATDASTIEDIEQRLAQDLDGGPTTGFRPRREGADLHFTQTFASITATKPPGSVDRTTTPGA